MAGGGEADGEVFTVEVSGFANLLTLLITAYQQGVITQEELLQALQEALTLHPEVE